MGHIGIRRHPTVSFLVLAGFLSGASVPMSAPASTIDVKTMLPLPGYPVDADTVLRADIAYRIGDFDTRRAKYVLVPMFESAEDADRTFNKLPGLDSGLRLKAASGVAHLVYPIRREWASGKLAMPIKVRFVVLEVAHDREPVTLVKSGVYAFKAL